MSCTWMRSDGQIHFNSSIFVRMICSNNIPRWISSLLCIELVGHGLSNSYTMACPPVRGDNPQALASGLSYVQVDKYGITILCHLHQCRPCTS